MSKKAARKKAKAEVETMASDPISPFLGETRAISFQSSMKHYIHAGILTKHEALNTLYDIRKGYIDLKDVPDSVGHILIHYLYSGTLKHQNSLELSLRVYWLAQRYGVSDLAQLAKYQIELLVETTTALQILETIQRACETFTETDAWLDEVVEAQARLLLKTCLIEVQAEVRTLLLTRNRVGDVLTKEMLLCCSKLTADAYRSLTVEEEHLMTDDYVAVRIDLEPSAAQDHDEESSTIHANTPEVSIVEGEPLPAQEQPSGMQTADNNLQWDNVKRIWKWPEEKMKKHKKYIHRDICVEEGDHILGGNTAWLGCGICRDKVANLAILYAEN